MSDRPKPADAETEEELDKELEDTFPASDVPGTSNPLGGSDKK